MLKITTQNFVHLCWISSTLWLIGCATSKDQVLPQSGPTMKQIYQQHFAKDSLAATVGRRPVQPAGLDLAGYTRMAFNEIDTLFPRLANPTLVMYVFPHLAGQDGVPVPGYSTAFTLYERTPYALPGEAPIDTQGGYHGARNIPLP